MSLIIENSNNINNFEQNETFVCCNRSCKVKVFVYNFKLKFLIIVTHDRIFGRSELYSIKQRKIIGETLFSGFGKKLFVFFV